MCWSGFGAFERAFPLSDDVDRERIEASLKNGLLTLILPESPEARRQVCMR